MSDSNNSSGGVGVCGLLLVLFVGLKLGGVISWSWLWVTSPIWLPLTVLLSVFGLAFLLMFIVSAVRRN